MAQFKTLSDFYDLMKALTGVDELDNTERAFFLSALKRRIRLAYDESSLWPNYVNTETRFAGLDYVIPYEEAAKDEIDTFINVWSAIPFDQTTNRKEQYIVNSEGAEVLGYKTKDYEDNYFQFVTTNYNASGATYSNDIAKKISTDVGAISFWIKGTIATDSGTELPIVKLAPDATVDGETTIKTDGSKVGVFCDWKTSATLNISVNGRGIGLFTSGSISPDISAYLDGTSLNQVVVSFTGTNTITMSNPKWGSLPDWSAASITAENTCNISDIRVLSEQVFNQTIGNMYSNPSKLYGSPALSSTLPTFYVAYKKFYDPDLAGRNSIPREFFDYGSHGAYADWLRGEGQTDKAMAEEGFAQQALEQQLQKIYRTSGSPKLWQSVRTHTTQQIR